MSLQVIPETERRWLEELEKILRSDRDGLVKARTSYGESWKKRGGVGAYMMLARKWDRLENILSKGPRQWDILDRLTEGGEETLLDTIRDLRRYLLLVEAEFFQSKKIPLGQFFADNKESLEEAGSFKFNQTGPRGFDPAQDCVTEDDRVALHHRFDELYDRRRKWLVESPEGTPSPLSLEERKEFERLSVELHRSKSVFD